MPYQVEHGEEWSREGVSRGKVGRKMEKGMGGTTI